MVRFDLCFTPDRSFAEWRRTAEIDQSIKVATEYGWAILCYRRGDFTAVIGNPRNGIALSPEFKIKDDIGLRLVFACEIGANAFNSRMG